jgi:C4-dicarboxylate-specific signal transduction histidine kinase
MIEWRSVDNLELKRMEVELIRVQAARAELEFRIIEREHDIMRIKEHIKVQLDKEEELKNKLKEALGDK